MSSRRLFLKKGLLTILGTFGLSSPVSAATTPEEKKWGMIIDINRCTGCQSCVIACKAQNNTAPDRFNTKILSNEEGSYPVSRVTFMPVQCNQCEDPPCVPACPEKAIFKLSNGIVVIDWNKCKGIKSCGDKCIKSCPYDALFPDPRFNNKPDKCDFCMNRLEKGLLPSCVESCSPKARIFGDANSPEGEFAKYLKRTDLKPRKPELKIKTNLLYVPSLRDKEKKII